MTSTIIGLSARELIEAIRGVVFATTDETFRYALHCIHWRIEDSKLTLTATNGRQLVRTDIWADYKGPTYETTIAAKDCRKLAGMLTKTATGLRVELCHGAADFSWKQTTGKNKGDKTFSCEENVARFPNCDEILREARKYDGETSLTVGIIDRDLATDPANCVVWNPTEKVFKRPTKVRGVDVRRIKGNVPDICFDLDFVADWIATLGVDSNDERFIELLIQDARSAVYAKHGKTEYVFMPMDQD